MDTKQISIKWKIFIYLLGFCALLLLILWLFQTVFLYTFYKRIKVSEIKNNADAVVRNVEDESMRYDIIRNITQDSDYYIEIMALNGLEIDSAGDFKNKIPPNKKDELLTKLENNEYTEYVTNSFEDTINAPFSRQSKKVMESIVYLRKAGDKIILINAMISPVDATVTTLRYQLYYITGIMILLAVLLAFIIAKRVSKPIEQLNQSAKVLAKGKYDVRFFGKGYKEIAELSNTLNIAALELNKVETLRKELMANISHDLRTPLSLIYGYAEVMHDFPNEITPDQTQTIMDETKRLTSLVNDVLDISKLESGTEKLNLTAFNLTMDIKAAAERVAELVRKDGYQISFFYDKEVNVRADEVKIMQVFYNLLINAINYTGTDKKITVRQVADTESVKIEVTDTGEGIAAEDLPYVWDRYYKTDKKHKRAVTGTGLGLSIVRKIIDLHNGSGGVETQAGKGSTFWFALKLNQ